MTTNNVTPTNYDNSRKAREEFESTKLGVKGLLDSGITHVPRLFHHPPEPLEFGLDNEGLIPVIDVSRPHPEVVERVREAASNVGFFQVVNHGVPISLLDRLVNGVRAFHELPAAEKASLYRRGTTTDGVATSFFSNYDLFAAKAACWRDSLQVRLGPTPLKPNDIPIVCRDEVMEWNKECEKLTDKLMGLLCEGLGLSEHRLKGMDYVGRRNMVGHYYPYCPEPEKTVGFPSHTDPGMLTVLIQDQVGGLQVNCNGKWVNVKPVHGALIVNLGDMFQIISNDEYKSGEHRVIANSLGDARVAIATFINPGTHDNFYEPLPELISPEKPALYRQFQFSELFSWFLNKELESKGVTRYYRL